MKAWEEALESLKDVTAVLKEQGDNGSLKVASAITLLSMSIQVQTLKVLERIEERLAANARPHAPERSDGSVQADVGTPNLKGGER